MRKLLGFLVLASAAAAAQTGSTQPDRIVVTIDASKTGEPISRCHVRGTLTSADRERPWVDTPMVHLFREPLAPGDRNPHARRHALEPNSRLGLLPPQDLDGVWIGIPTKEICHRPPGGDRDRLVRQNGCHQEKPRGP